jgi:hypothetical protein
MEDDGSPPQPAAAVPLPARVFPPPTLWPAARNREVNVMDVEDSVTAYLQEDTNNPSRSMSGGKKIYPSAILICRIKCRFLLEGMGARVKSSFVKYS